MLVFGQKSCFLGPTIFEIPQPNDIISYVNFHNIDKYRDVVRGWAWWAFRDGTRNLGFQLTLIPTRVARLRQPYCCMPPPPQDLKTYSRLCFK